MASTTAALDARRDTPSRPQDRRWWNGLVAWVALAVVVACCAFVFFQLQPRLLLRDTTVAGGDTGAHVWWPAYLRDHLLPWRLAGWAPDWYAGFPAGQFYFPIPALLIVALDLVLPYNVAFKLVTALGPVLMPAGAYVLARGLRAPRVVGAALAVGATAFLFFNGDPGTSDAGRTIAFNQHIMGGNLASTLAGEFSFALALALALFTFGALATALRTGRTLWLPAVLLAATVMSHLVVGIYVAIGAVLVWLLYGPLRTVGRAAAIGVVGALLTTVWTLPLLATVAYTTDMRYEPIRSYVDYLFPSYLWKPDGLAPYDWGAAILVGIAVVAAVVRRRRVTFFLLALTATMGIVFRYWEDVQATPAWNLRMVPFWYLGVFLLMAVGVAELILAAGDVIEWLVGRWRRRRSRAVDAPAEPETEIVVEAPVEVPAAVEEVPPGERSRLAPGLVRALVVVALLAALSIGALYAIDDGKDFLPYWTKYNYSGYEASGPEAERTGVAKAYPEYRQLMETMEALPPGRALWEGGSSIGKYGTPLALMLLPYWTDGRIGSIEGLYFEASGTTPYHFMTVASLATAGNASNPVRGIPYRMQNDFQLGVRWLQKLGVRYFLTAESGTQLRADRDPRLELVATSPDLDGDAPKTWNVYEVKDAPLVEPLRFEPVVVEGASTHDWEEEVGVPWWDDAGALDRPIVAGGPDSWKRADPTTVRTPPRRDLPKVRVTDVRTSRDSVSFRVSRTGVPVVVKTSSFPNWRASGAEGPWRATPNFMVVVPTEREVTLSYETTGAEWLGRLGTAAGLAGVVLLALWPGWARRRRRREEEAPAATTMGFPPAGGEDTGGSP